MIFIVSVIVAGILVPNLRNDLVKVKKEAVAFMTGKDLEKGLLSYQVHSDRLGP